MVSVCAQVTRWLLVVGSIVVFWNAYGLGVNLTVGAPTQVPEPDVQQFTQRFYPECSGPDRVNLTRQIMARLTFPSIVWVTPDSALTYNQGCNYWYWSEVNIQINPWWVGWTLTGVILAVVCVIVLVIPMMIWGDDHDKALTALYLQSLTVFWAWIAWYGYSRAQDLERCTPLELQALTPDGGTDGYVASILSGAYFMLTNQLDYDWANNVVLASCSNLLIDLTGPDGKLILPLSSSDRVQDATHDAVTLFQNCCWSITAAWFVIVLFHLYETCRCKKTCCGTCRFSFRCCIKSIDCCCCGARCDDQDPRRCIRYIDCCCCRFEWGKADKVPLLHAAVDHPTDAASAPAVA
jgi:hypothetical protein